MKIFSIFIASILFCAVQSASAQTATPTEAAAKEEEKEVILKPGTIASSGRFTNRTGHIDAVTDGSVAGDETMAIGATVKKVSDGKCTATLTNSDKEAGYSVNFEISSTSRGSGFPKKRSFSGTVPAGGTLDRSFSCDALDNFQVNLKGGKRLKPKK